MRRSFTDGAGYRRHCWECNHAKSWRDSLSISGRVADCELTGFTVGRYDSPDNPCHHMGTGGSYETQGR